jgi:hypothetical protein
VSGERLSEVLVEALRPLVLELVEAEVDRRLGELSAAAESRPFLTVADYARLHSTSPAAIRARIRRGALHAIRPPGAREYLIPSGDGEASGTIPRTQKPSAPAPRERPGA